LPFRPFFPFPEGLGGSRRRHALQVAALVPCRSRLRWQRSGVPDLRLIPFGDIQAVAGRAEDHAVAKVLEGKEFLARLGIT
jgi:hypothetical protein